VADAAAAAKTHCSTLQPSLQNHSKPLLGFYVQVYVWKVAAKHIT
jgi:hypothetical protein